MSKHTREAAMLTILLLVALGPVVAGDPDDGGYVEVGDADGDPAECTPGPEEDPCGTGVLIGGVDEPENELCEVPDLGTEKADQELQQYMGCGAGTIGVSLDGDGPEDDPGVERDYVAYMDGDRLIVEHVQLLCLRENSPLHQWNVLEYRASTANTTAKIRLFENTPAGGGDVELWVNGSYHSVSTGTTQDPKTAWEVLQDLESDVDDYFATTLSLGCPSDPCYLGIRHELGTLDEVWNIGLKITDTALILTEMAIEPTLLVGSNDTSCNHFTLP